MTAEDDERWITEDDKRWLQWMARQGSLEPLSKRDWEMIELGLSLERSKETNGNRLKANHTDLEQERVSLLAARKMKATGMSKTAVRKLMVEVGIKWVFKDAIIGDDRLEDYLEGDPRGEKPEDYIAREENSSTGLVTIEAEIRDWEERTGLTIESGLPDFGPPNPEG